MDSRMSVLGGSSGRRDVAGLNVPKQRVSSIESRVKALEQKSTPPVTKNVDPTLLALRSGLSSVKREQSKFSDPLKEGILAVRQGLRGREVKREVREDELKVSIVNARKGLKRAGSRETEDTGSDRGQGTAVRGRGRELKMKEATVEKNDAVEKDDTVDEVAVEKGALRVEKDTIEQDADESHRLKERLIEHEVSEASISRKLPSTAPESRATQFSPKPMTAAPRSVTPIKLSSTRANVSPPAPRLPSGVTATSPPSQQTRSVAVQSKPISNSVVTSNSDDETPTSLNPAQLDPSRSRESTLRSLSSSSKESTLAKGTYFL
jgi:hypothetical protein